MAWIRWRKTKRGRRAYVQWRDQDGKVHSEATGTGDARLAEDHRKRIELTVEGKAPAVEDEATALDLLDAFLGYAAVTKSHATAKSYGDYLRPMLRHWAAVPYAEWTRAMLEHYLQQKRREHLEPGAGGWGERTAQIALSGCRQWVKWARANGHALADFVGELRAGRAMQKAPKHLRPEQMRALLAVARGHVLETAIALGLLVGMRRKEWRSARAKDVDIEARSIVVRGSKNYKERVLPISDTLAEILQRRMPEAGPITSVQGDPTGSYHALRALCKRAGVPEITWHALRHSCAQALLTAQATLPEVQAFLGHASLATTGKYLLAQGDVARGAANRMLG